MLFRTCLWRAELPVNDIKIVLPVFNLRSTTNLNDITKNYTGWCSKTRNMYFKNYLRFLSVLLPQLRFAYHPADATATHCLLLQQNPDWFIFWYRLTWVVPEWGPLKCDLLTQAYGSSNRSSSSTTEALPLSAGLTFPGKLVALTRCILWRLGVHVINSSSSPYMAVLMIEMTCVQVRFDSL